MILGINGIVASQIAQVDPDAAAFFARVTAAGGSLTATEQTATNQLVLDLKANSLWTPMKAIYPMVGASAEACKQNLKSSSFTGTFTSGWTFASTGVTPNGSSAYFDTGFIPNTSLTFNSASFSVYSRNDFSAATNKSFGCAINPASIPLVGATFVSTKVFNSYIYSYTTDLISAPPQNFAAMFLVTRTSNSSAKSFRNSSNIASVTTNAQTTQPTNSFLFGALRLASSIVEFLDFQHAFAHIGDGLTDTQASNFYTAVQSFQTTLSRQV
jgi:hypothetical protein